MTSEKASSYQGKAVKTVIAAAVATLVAGSAMAASYIDPVEGAKVYADKTAEQTDTLNDSIVYKKTENGAGALVTPNQSYTFDKTLWVIADQAKAETTGNSGYVQANGFFMASGADDDSKLINKGTIYVTALNKAHYWATHAMSGDKGEIINDGTIIAKNAVALASGSKGNGVKIINNGTIVVENQGRAIGLEAGKAPVAENNGTITVGALAEGAEQIIGVYISDNVTNASFTNKKGGVINAAAEGAIAIVFGEGSNNTATLASGSVTQGDIVVKSADSTNNIEIEKDASVTGDVIVKLGTAALTGAEGAAVDGDLIAAAGAATVAKELTFKNVTVGTAAVEKTDTTPEVKATDGSVTVNSKSELYADTVTLNTAGSEFTNNGYTELGTVTFAKASTAGASTRDTPANGFVNNGEAVIEKLVFVNGSDVFTNGKDGSVEIGSVVVPLNSDGGEVTLTGVTNQGKVYTDLKNVAAKDEDGKWGATAFGTALKGSSILDESITSDVTLDEYKEIIGVLGDKVALHSANITTTDGDAISLTDATSVGSGDFGHAEVAGTYSTGTPNFEPQISKALSFGSFTFTPASEKTPAITSAALGNTANKITLRGDKNGNVINGVKSDVAVTLTNVTSALKTKTAVRFRMTSSSPAILRL
ncbi:hypothetical protein [Sutterella wadsworthensis]|uniref:hypothetical protein n=1 Tax=Sutterella wadsworthensis TaxID=40545 RepID=UPI0024201C34|nr:hypothetical protein [Sutterella wadsworthensis]